GPGESAGSVHRRGVRGCGHDCNREHPDLRPCSRCRCSGGRVPPGTHHRQVVTGTQPDSLDEPHRGPVHAARLFDAQEQGATDARLQEIAAEALKEVYFQDSGRRAGSLEEVRFTDIQHLEFEL
ncbi:hypothetical protein ACFU6N_12170, partial [Streptomyces sp. NPDC057496]